MVVAVCGCCGDVARWWGDGGHLAVIGSLDKINVSKKKRTEKENNSPLIVVVVVELG